MSVMRPEVMSSAEISEDDGEEVIVVHQLPWLTKEVHDEIKKKQSPQARQTKHRVIGYTSTRSLPTDEHFSTWALVN